jgi:sec-independent protein translocase protein TatA
MGRIGFGELLVIALVLLLLFGAKRLPELGRSLGQALREFQRGMKGHDDHDHDRKENG